MFWWLLVKQGPKRGDLDLREGQFEVGQFEVGQATAL